MSKCIVVSAGDFSPELMCEKQPGDLLMAADGGYGYLNAMGIEPDMCVGDFDSLGFQPKGRAVVALPVEKDDTDMLACARIGLERGYREFLFFGALGGKRFSHSLAAVQTLYWLKKRGADGCIVDERCRITVAMDETVAFDESSRGSLSVFSLTDTAVVTQRGVHYPLDRYELNNAFPLGVSNNFIGEKAEITVHSGAVAIITEEKV